MIETKKIPLSKLLKLEVAPLLDHFIHILERHNPEKLHLDGMYDFLLDQKSKVAYLIDPYGPHPLTERLNEMHAKRLSYATMINSELENLDKPHFYDTLNLVKIARPKVKFFLSNLGKKSRDNVLDSIEAFFIRLDNEPPVKEALIALGLESNLDELRKANIEHEKTLMLRTKSISQRPKVNTQQVMREAQKVMRWSLEQVDSCQATYTDLDYRPLINELNTVLTIYSKNIRTRIAKNKRKKNRVEK